MWWYCSPFFFFSLLFILLYWWDKNRLWCPVHGAVPPSHSMCQWSFYCFHYWSQTLNCSALTRSKALVRPVDRVPPALPDDSIVGAHALCYEGEPLLPSSPPPQRGLLWPRASFPEIHRTVLMPSKEMWSQDTTWFCQQFPPILLSHYLLGGTEESGNLRVTDFSLMLCSHFSRKNLRWEF